VISRPQFRDIFCSARRHQASESQYRAAPLIRRSGHEGQMNFRQAVQLVFVIALGIVFALPIAAQSNNKKGDTELRTIRGTALDKDENPAPSSVIYLLNVRTQAVKTYIADDAGNFRFSGLDPNADYEIHAESDDMESPVRTVSGFDSRRDIEVNLKLSRKKAAR
jgi:hypothetical protein